MQLAADLCHDMDQECVFVGWGPEGLLAFDTRSGRDAAVARFSALPRASSGALPA